MLAGHAHDLLDERLGGRQPHLADGALDHERVGEVVDVLARAREVDELAHGRQDRLVAEEAGGGGDATLDEVLDCLDVVDGLPLDLGELGDAGGAEVGDDRAEVALLVLREACCARDDLLVGEVDEPLDLDVEAFAVERGLGEVIDERRDRAAVAAVERTEGDRRVRVGEDDAVGHGRGRRRRHGGILPRGTDIRAGSSDLRPDHR